MLRKIRIGVSLVLFALITLFFLDFSELLPTQFHALAHIQFVPALLSMSFIILIVLLTLTLVFGRIYCSTICPMGIFQDVVARISKATTKKKKYRFSPAKNRLRWTVLVLSVVAFLLGSTVVIGVLDPYSAYGRIVVSLFKPIYLMGNNLLESIFSHFNNYTFYQVEVSINSLTSFVVAFITLLAVAITAWKHGRTWCNTLCPVGTLLGFLTRFSIFKIHINIDKCNHCGRCATRCKAACINSKEQIIDYSRCVGCFDCLEACNQKALVYAPSVSVGKQHSDASKRRFLLISSIGIAATPQLLAKAKVAMASMGGRKAYTKQHPITPPGTVGQEHFEARCTSCHLCVSKCPSHVLKPAFKEYGWGGVMQPTVSFDKGFCNFDCTVCGEVCPNGAIKRLTIEQKHLTQMGYVVFVEENCIVHTDGTNCGACSEHCPTQAVAMIPYKNGLTIPRVNTEICVGCGGCEYVCPARPFRAIYIEGNPVQKQAKPFKEATQEKVDIDGFGF